MTNMGLSLEVPPSFKHSIPKCVSSTQHPKMKNSNPDVYRKKTGDMLKILSNEDHIGRKQS